MFCTKCGAALEEGEKYCSVCGAEVQKITDTDRKKSDESLGKTTANSSISPALEMPSAKKHRLGLGLKIGIIAAAVLLVLGVAFTALGGPDTVNMYRQLSLGRRYLDEMEYEQAIVAFEEAIEIAPYKPDPYIALAEAYMEMEEYDKAIEVLMEGLDETGSSKIEDYLAEIMEDLRGFTGTVYAADTDLDDDNNMPIRDAHIKIEGEEDEQTDTNRRGEYAVDHLPQGEYTLTFSADGYISYTTEINLKDERYHLDVVLEPDAYAQMSGNITIADEDTNYGNNTPLSDAEISLEKLTGSNPYEETVTTDANGTYTFDDVVMGVYELTIEKEGYQTTRQNIVVYEDQQSCYNAMIEIFPAEWGGLGTASGMVYDAVTGYGVEGLTLNIRQGINQLDGPVEESITTSSDGSYITPELQSGNYTIEIVDERRNGEEEYLSNLINIKVLGNTDISNQDGVVSTTMLSGQVRIVLNWGAEPWDLDSHLWCSLNSGEMCHVYFNNPEFYLDGSMIADLDLDDTDCYGPETTTIYTPDEGIYTFGIYNYSHNYNDDLMQSGASVSVYLESSLTPSYVFYVPMESGYYWEVFSYDSTTHRLTPINQVMNDYDDYNYN